MVTSGQLWGAALTIIVSLVTLMVKLHLQNRQDAAADRKAQRERDIRWDMILREHPNHSHGDLGGEDTGLKKGNIRYAKSSA